MSLTPVRLFSVLKTRPWNTRRLTRLTKLGNQNKNQKTGSRGEKEEVGRVVLLGMVGVWLG